MHIAAWAGNRSIPTRTLGTDLGDMRLEALPVLAGGLVVGSDQRGIAGLNVILEYPQPSTQENWSVLDGATAVTDAEGSFLLRGEPMTGVVPASPREQTVRLCKSHD